jgi:cell division protein FtsZ
MIEADIQGVEFITLNTDAQALLRTEAPTKLPLGMKLTKGLGVGGDPNMGMEAAEESREELTDIIDGADMVFIAAGMGGGTGTGAAPVVAQIAKEMGILTIAVVTKPFAFEGNRRKLSSEQGIARLVDRVDTLIVIPNERLLSLCGDDVTAENAFGMADDVVQQGVKSIAELITTPGEINLDFADVKAIMSNAGPAWMAIGHGSGPNRSVEAAQAALASPILDMAIEGARGVLFNVTAGTDFKLHEINQAAAVISKALDPDANIIFGLVKDPEMGSDCKVTLIATGFIAKTSETAAPSEERLQSFLRGQEEEHQLDVPTILRKPRPMQHTRDMVSHSPLINNNS